MIRGDLFHAANLKRSVLFLYECDEKTILPELEAMHADLKLGKAIISSHHTPYKLGKAIV